MSKNTNKKKQLDYSIQEKLQIGDNCLVKYEENNGSVWYEARVTKNNLKKRKLSVEWVSGKWEGTETKNVSYRNVGKLKKPRSLSNTIEKLNDNIVNLEKKIYESTEKIASTEERLFELDMAFPIEQGGL